MLRYICPGCERLVEPESVRRSEDCFEISCPRCGEVETVAAGENRRMGEADARRAEEEAPTSTGEEDADEDEAADAAEDLGLRCPKCDERRGTGDACPRCGLVFDRWEPGADGEVAPELHRLWEELCKSWSDRALHAKFVEACLAEGALSFAAKSYGSRDDEMAREQVRKLTAMAFQAMQSSETFAGPDPKVGRVVGWGLFFALLLGLLGFLLYMYQR